MRTPLPLRRWSINLLCGLSLLIFLLAMPPGIWVRSYFADEMTIWVSGATPLKPGIDYSRIVRYGIDCTRGTLVVFRDRFEGDHLSTAPTGWAHVSRPPHSVVVHTYVPGERLNLHLGKFQLLYRFEEHPIGFTSGQYLIVPLWLFLLFAIPPLLWVRRWRRRQGRGFPVEVRGSPAELDAAATGG